MTDNIFYHKIINDNAKIKYVYHLSDIHIRNTQRHDEYKRVFDTTCDDIMADITTMRESLIVITGDILHNKTEMSPEVIYLARYFFKKMTDICDVIVIAGNHDCNITNKSRMDALFPIIQDNDEFLRHDVNNQPIIQKQGSKGTLYYLRKTGFYHYQNIIFGVTNIFDTEFLSHSKLDAQYITKNEDKYCIALFHGTIDNSQVDSGFKISNGHLNVGVFKGYDYAFLGDIHKYQYMDKRRTIAYPGSLIQQSFGETIENHGYIKWSLADGTSQHHSVHNDWGFCTIEIVDGKMNAHDAATIPKKPRIRFLLQNTTQSTYQKIKDDLQKKYPISEIVKETTMGTQTKLSCTTNDFLSGINTDDAAHTQKITEYLKNVGKSTDTINKIVTLHNKIYNKIAKENKYDVKGTKVTYFNQSWEISRLEFSNAFSYGSNNIIDFTLFEKNQIIGIFAPNHYGKSAVLDIVLFCLFDKSSRGTKQDIMNKNKNNMNCKIIFKIGTKEYCVERAGVRSARSKNDSVKTSAKFFFRDTVSGDIVDLTCDDKNDTNRKISEIVGSYNDYLTTCICLQQSNNGFIEAKQSERKVYLQKILNVDIFKHCHLWTSNKLKKLQIKTKIIDQEQKRTNIDATKDAIIKCRSEITLLENKIAMCNDLRDQLEFRCAQITPKMPVYADLLKYGLNSSSDVTACITKLHNVLTANPNINLTDQEAMLRASEDNIGRIQNLLQKLANERLCVVAPITTSIEELTQAEEKLRHEIRQHTVTSEYDNYTESELRNVMDKLNDKNLSHSQKIIPCLQVTIEDIWCVNNRYRMLEHEFYATNYYSDPNEKIIITTQMNCNAQFISYLRSIIDDCTDADTVTELKQWISTKENWNCAMRGKIVGTTIDVAKVKACFEEKNIKNIAYMTSKDNAFYQAKIERNKSTISNINRIIHARTTLSQYAAQLNKIQEQLACARAVQFNCALDRQLTQYKCELDLEMQRRVVLAQNISEAKLCDDNLLKDIGLLHLCTLNYAQYERDVHTKANISVDISKITTDVERHRTKLSEAKYKLKESKTTLAEYCSREKMLNKNAEKIELYQIYFLITNHHNGLPCDMIRKCLEPLSADINRILSSFVSFTISISSVQNAVVTAGKTKGINKKSFGDINIKLHYLNKKPIDISLASGFERFIVSLATRISLSCISKTCKPNFFVIDEGWNCMDTDNLSNVSIVMDYIKQLYDHVIIISHLDELKRQSNYVINIERDKNKFSHINYQRAMQQ